MLTVDVQEAPTPTTSLVYRDATPTGRVQLICHAVVLLTSVSWVKVPGSVLLKTSRRTSFPSPTIAEPARRIHATYQLQPSVVISSVSGMTSLNLPSGDLANIACSCLCQELATNGCCPACKKVFLLRLDLTV
ncbi:hypothetical protein C2E23DRAFT_351646 [Lenzites betulinus]|nr:hypothetical protein C2E23DRAFT_351646 [Lenzites betulinus]